MQNTARLKAALGNQKFIPVIDLEKLGDITGDARALAEALRDAGLPLVEVLFRHASSEHVARKMAEVDGVTVAAGTMRNTETLKRAEGAGCQLFISAALSPVLLEAAEAYPHIDLLPGVVTPTDVMTAEDAGYELLKFYPAELNGGRKTLETYRGAFPKVKFCPTDGLTVATIPAYLNLENVFAVGGTKALDMEAIRSGDYEMVERKARQFLADIRPGS